jgi:hypothetical protein
MAYPGVRLGQRGGLYDLYQYYLGGGDQVTDAPVSTVNTTQFIQPVSGGQGDGQVGGANEYQGVGYPESQGSGIFSSQYRPDNFGVDRNITTFGAAGKPIMSGYIEEDEDNFLDKIGARTRSFFDTSGIANIFSKIPTPLNLLNKAMFREGATESRPGIGGLYANEVSLLDSVAKGEYLDPNNPSKDIFGLNIVSAFGDYKSAQDEIKDYYENIQKTDVDKFDKLMLSAYHKGRYDNALNVTDDYSVASKATVGDAKRITDRIDTGIIQRGPNEGDAGITQTITTPVEASEVAYQAPAPAKTPSHQGGRGGGSDASGRGQTSASASNRGSGSAATSGGSSTGRSDGGWGWKDGGLVTRKPYGDGGIVDLL